MNIHEYSKRLANASEAERKAIVKQIAVEFYRSLREQEIDDRVICELATEIIGQFTQTCKVLNQYKEREEKKQKRKNNGNHEPR